MAESLFIFESSSSRSIKSEDDGSEVTVEQLVATEIPANLRALYSVGLTEPKPWVNEDEKHPSLPAQMSGSRDSQ